LKELQKGKKKIIELNLNNERKELSEELKCLEEMELSDTEIVVQEEFINKELVKPNDLEMSNELQELENRELDETVFEDDKVFNLPETDKNGLVLKFKKQSLNANYYDGQFDEDLIPEEEVHTAWALYEKDCKYYLRKNFDMDVDDAENLKEVCRQLVKENFKYKDESEADNFIDNMLKKTDYAQFIMIHLTTSYKDEYKKKNKRRNIDK